MMNKAAASLFHRTELSRFEETCSRVLMYCNVKSLEEGLHIQSPIIKLGIRDHLDLTNNLLSLYVKSNKIDSAHQLFDEMSERDVVSWTSMISGYTKSRKHESALQMFGEMRVCGYFPNEFTFSSVIRSCAGLGELGYGASVHGSVVKNGYESNPVLCSSLMDFYSKCDCKKEACDLFGRIENGDTISWTTMISSFVESQKPNEALGLYLKMIKSGVCPNEFTFVKLLAACASLDSVYGEAVHAHIIVWGIKPNLVLKTALVDFYSRFGNMSNAMRVSESTCESDVFLWTSIVSGFTRNLQFKEAIDAYSEMQVYGFRPNNFTYLAMLNLCSCLESLNLGRQIHSQAIRSGLEDYVSVGNALIDFYMKHSCETEYGLRAFRGMDSPNAISWTAVISGLAGHGLRQECFELFREMLAQGTQPNSAMFSSVLRACRETESVKLLLELHGYILKTNAEIETMVGNCLVDAYAGLGMVSYAWSVIRMMDSRDNITYTTMVTRLNESGYRETALSIIHHMNHDGVKIDQFSLTGFLSASANIGALKTGRHLHGYAVKHGLTGISVSNGLVDLYGKCGCIEDAERAFRETSEPDVVSWNGLMSSLVLNEFVSSALSAFEDMKLRGAKPDGVSFLIVLSACCNSSLVEMGLEYFQSMRENFNIQPKIDHYVYLVDLLGRAGRLREAVEVAETMPLRPNALIFKTLLRACRIHGNLTLGEDMARTGLELDPFDPAFYVLLADLYEETGKSELAEKTRTLMTEKGLKKKHGSSSVEIDGKVHNFSTKDVSLSCEAMKEVYDKIKSLTGEFGRLGFAYRAKEDAVHHSAKVAVVFGLLNAPQKALIHVVKNKNLCRDCHSFISLVSKVSDREIVLRDGNRIHKFKNGHCSCTWKRTSFV